MDVLCKSLARDFKLEVVFLSLELAWNLLENAPAAAHVALDDAGRESLVSVVTRQVGIPARHLSSMLPPHPPPLRFLPPLSPPSPL